MATASENERFGVTLRRLRKAARFSQDALGEKAGINGQTISNIENGAVFPRDETYRSLADALNLTVAQLDAEWQTKGVIEVTADTVADLAFVAEAAGVEPAEWLRIALDDAIVELEKKKPNAAAKPRRKNHPTKRE